MEEQVFLTIFLVFCGVFSFFAGMTTIPLAKEMYLHEKHRCCDVVNCADDVMNDIYCFQNIPYRCDELNLSRIASLNNLTCGFEVR